MTEKITRWEFTGEERILFGTTLRQIRACASFGSVSAGDLGGWLESEHSLPQGGTGWVHPEAVVFRGAVNHGGEFCGGTFRGGTFRGGTFWGGTFHGGTFCGGTFRGGTFWGGEFCGGTFSGGTFCGGEFRCGTFCGGEFRGGTFCGGVFCGGTFWGCEFDSSPAMAQRSDGHCFIVHPVGGDLRVWAGCRDFSWDEAIAHWNDGHRHGPESREIIQFLRGQLRHRPGSTFAEASS